MIFEDMNSYIMLEQYINITNGCNSHYADALHYENLSM